MVSFVVRESSAPAPSSSVTFETPVIWLILSRACFYPHFLDAEMEAQQVCVTQGQVASMVLGPGVNLNCD